MGAPGREHTAGGEQRERRPSLEFDYQVVSDDEAIAAKAAAVSTVVCGPEREETILCVDDEPHVLSSLRRLLRRTPYNVLLAGGGQEALGMLARKHVQVILTDMRMPGVDGPKLLEKARQLYPDTVRMVLTGYADLGSILDAINRGEIYRFITKPWTDEDLLTAIGQAFSEYRLRTENARLTRLTAEQNAKLRKLNEDLQRQVIEVETLRLRTQAVLDQMADGVAVIDVAGRCVMINPVARRILGLDKRPIELDDDIARLALDMGPDDLLDRLATSAQSMLRMEVEKKGRVYEALVTPVKDAHSPGTGAVIVLRDITEARGADVAPAAVVSRYVSALAGPLAAAQVALRNVLDPSMGPWTQQQLDFLQVAERNLARLADVFDSLGAAAGAAGER